MEKKTYKAQTTPGRQTFTLSRNEVIKAVFVATQGRKPTDDEADRLSLNIWDTRDMRNDEWSLVLTFNDR